MDGRVAQCSDPGVRCWTASGRTPVNSNEITCGKSKVICLKSQKSCGNSCYNPRTQTCSSFTTSNGATVEFVSQTENLNSLQGFFVIALVLLFLLAMIAALVGSMLVAGKALGGLATGGKVLLVLSVLQILFSLFFLFHQVWESAVTLWVSAIFTILGVAGAVAPSSSGPLEETLLVSSIQDPEGGAGGRGVLGSINKFTIVVLAVQLITVLYLVGLFPRPNILSFGPSPGPEIASQRCDPTNMGTHFTNDAPRLNVWMGSIINPQDPQWGYCSSGMQVWQLICTSFCVLLALAIWIGHTLSLIHI